MTKGYDPNNDILTADGLRIVYDEFDWDFDEDRNTWTVGTSGETTVTVNASKLSTLNVTVPMTSQANAILSALYQANATFPVSFTSSNSTFTKAAGTAMKINRMAPVGRAKESGQNVYVIKGDMEAIFHSEYDDE